MLFRRRLRAGGVQRPAQFGRRRAARPPAPHINGQLPGQGHGQPQMEDVARGGWQGHGGIALRGGSG